MVEVRGELVDVRGEPHELALPGADESADRVAQQRPADPLVQARDAHRLPHGVQPGRRDRAAARGGTKMPGRKGHMSVPVMVSSATVQGCVD